MRLDRFDSAAFLREYWQKKVLLIRNPWDSWRNPLEPAELAGLACEDEVESRLITRTGDKWEVEHGPIPEQRFEALGSKGWTLLVQAVDQHVPDVADLLAPFRFIPNWRIDDVMVSYAADQGGVGPHFDHYDVFLIQGLGRRRWRIGARCGADAALLPNDDLRLLATFEAVAEWILEPGDILYVPPGVAHEGTAVGDDCMTYSIGFRAPSRGDLIAQWSEHLVADMPDDDLYADPDLEPQDNPGEIGAHALARLHAMVTEAMRDRDSFARWFGRFSTSPKYPDMDWRPDAPIAREELRARLSAGQALSRNPAGRFSFVRQAAGPLLLFVDGSCFECGEQSAALAELICAKDRIDVDADLIGSEEAAALIETLVNQGSLAFDEEGEE